MGRYDQALERYMGALDLRRSAGDRRNAALASYGIGAIFDYQGRFGAAVKSKGEALQTFRELGQRDSALVEILAGYGASVTLAGKMGDAVRPLEEAAKLATELKNPTLLGQVLLYQADRQYYSGDLNAASETAKRAAEAASASADRTLVLAVDARQAMIASADRPSRGLLATLQKLSAEAESRGLRSLAVEIEIARLEALHRLGDHEEAVRSANRVLARADALGLRVPRAKAHYVSAVALAARGDATGARREHQATVRLLAELRRDEGNADVLKRVDLARIHAEAVKGSQTL
jgi:tetratricopeptide (TPR) repeat protein